MPTRHFRADIQGLRAISALMVVLFHFGFPGPSGGFLGVDIFFVISGFLITQILHRSDHSLTDLLAFLRKRAWRLAPAQTAVILASLVYGYLYLLPDDFDELGKESLSSLTFWANIYFNNDSGYFARDAFYRPLLHLWSLGVEAQFYLLAAIAFLIINTMSQKTKKIGFWAVVILSLLIAQILAFTDPKTAFYNPLTRLWEFMIGGCAAAYLARERIETEKEILSGNGTVLRVGSLFDGLALAAILILPFVYFEGLSWPMPFALVPCLAAGWLLLNADRPGLARLALSHPAMIFLGNLSYALYLVHWPLIVFARFQYGPEIPFPVGVALFLLTFALAVTVYYLIESPCRAFGRRRSAYPHLIGAGILMCIMALGLQVHVQDGLPDRFSKSVLAELDKPDQPRPSLRDICDEPQLAFACPERVATLAGTTVALWGDSHAMALDAALAQWLEANDASLVSFIHDSCPPLPDVYLKSSLFSPPKQKCLPYGRPTLENLLRDESVQIVVLTARWANYMTGHVFDKDAAGAIYLTAFPWEFPSLDRNQALSQNSLENTISLLQAAGKQVVLIGSVPELNFDGIRCFNRSRLHGADANACAIGKGRVDARLQSVRKSFAGLQTEFTDLLVIDPALLFCSGETCRSVLDGRNVYRDDNHLNNLGAFAVVKDLSRALNTRQSRD